MQTISRAQQIVDFLESIGSEKERLSGTLGNGSQLTLTDNTTTMRLAAVFTGHPYLDDSQQAPLVRCSSGNWHPHPSFTVESTIDSIGVPLDPSVRLLTELFYQGRVTRVTLAFEYDDRTDSPPPDMSVDWGFTSAYRVMSVFGVSRELLPAINIAQTITIDIPIVC
jgi:hypothetical protein